MIIQRLLIQYILDPLARLMGKASKGKKDAVFVVSFLCIILQHFLKNCYVVNYRYLYYYAANCLFLGLMILCSMPAKIKPVKFRRCLAVCWFGVGIMMLLSGILNNPDYLPEAVLFLIVFPIVFIVWNNTDRTKIFSLLLSAYKISVVIFIVASFLFSKISSSIYPGIFHNTNGAAYYLSVGAVCLAIECLTSKYLDKKFVVNIILFGITCALMYYTNSRTGPLALIVAFIGGTVVYMLTHSAKENKTYLIRTGAMAISVAVFVVCLVYVFQLRRYLDIPYFDTKTGMFYFEQKQPATDVETGIGETPVQDDDGFFGITEYNKKTEEKTEIGEQTLNQYSTGRIGIWKAYAKDLNLFGHAYTPSIYFESMYKYISSTHMTILQIAYESGIIAGLLYLLLNIGTGLFSIRFAWKNREEKYALLPLMLILSFGVMSMLGSCGVSMWYMTTFMYYLVLFPIMVSVPEEA